MTSHTIRMTQNALLLEWRKGTFCSVWLDTSVKPDDLENKFLGRLDRQAARELIMALTKYLDDEASWIS